MTDKNKDSVLSVPISGSVSGNAHKPSNNEEAPRENIEDVAKREATQAGMNLTDWQPSYAGLVKSVAGFYAKEINKIIFPINRQVGKYFNGLRYNLDAKTDSILLEAKTEFGSLHSDAQKYNRDFSEFNKKLQKEQRIFPDLSEDDIRKTSIKTSADWLLFFAILGLIVLLESAANMSLLSTAIEGGLIQAFMVALLVSIINVMGVGTGIGFLCAFLFRKARTVCYVFLPIWFFLVVVLNLVVGRHREGFVRDIEAKEKAADAASAVEGIDSLVITAEELSEISFGVHAWHFESVLFFLLGIVLSCFGFYKGFFILRRG